MVEITHYGHSAFRFAAEGHAIVVDPFLTGNPVAPCGPEAIECDHVAITHGHADHLGDAAAIAKRTGAIVHAAFEICCFLEEQGVANTSPGNPGGRVRTPFGFVAFTQAFHSSSYEGRYMGMPCGLVISIGGKTIYHAGDTALFSDMRLIGEIYRPDLAILPIGDRFTMGPDLAMRAAEMIGAPEAIPCHFDTWPPIAQDPTTFAPEGVKVHVLRPGDVLRLE